MPQALGKPLVFAAGPVSGHTAENVVDIFLQGSNARVGQISDRSLDLPIGLATDVSGNLYVANQNAPTVPVFAPPYTKGPTRVLEAPGYLPQGVGVSSAGIVAVGNFCNRSNCKEFYDVSFYAKGATKPCKTIPLAPNAIAGQVSFDQAGDAFVAGQIFSTELPYIAEIKGGCEAKVVTPLTAKNKLGQIFDVHVTKQDKVALLDADAGKIYTYDLPVKDSLGDPVYTTPAPNAFNFAFLASGLDVYSNFLTLHGAGLSEFSYPSGHVYKNFATAQYNYVAVWPSVVP
jgi:hypothetical protein